MKRSALLLSLALLLAAPAAWAQDVPARLTLEAALDIARRNNPEYRQVLNDIDVAAMGERRSWGALLPDVSASVGFNGFYSRSLTGTGDFGEVLEGEEYRELTSSSASQGIDLSMTLFDGGANLNTLRAARADVRVADARVSAQEVQLRADVAIGFYDALEAQQTIHVEEQLLASAEDQLRMTQRRFEIGSARRDEVLGAEVTVAEQQRALEAARNESRKARLRLLQAMGVDRSADFAIADDVPAIFDPAALDGEALVAAALGASPRVLAQRASVAAAERRSSVARGSRWPRITASAGYGRSFRDDEYGALFAFDLPDQSWRFGISASLPLFTGFQTSYDIAQAQAQVDDAEEQLRADRLALEVEVRSALLDLRNAHRSLELAERSLVLSQERLELTQERYRVGATVSFVDLQSAIDQAARAERQVILARFGFIGALVTLESRVGKEVRP